MATSPFVRLVALLALAPMLTPTTAVAEILTVPSRSFSDEEFLRGDVSLGKPVKLTGILQIPDGTQPSPIVILMHGTDGPSSGAVLAWRGFFKKLGFATFSLDSYTGRGLREASTDQNAFGQFTQIFDAYRAVEVLAGNPHIDQSRIALMGFSRGGTATLYATLKRFHHAFGPKDGKIVAYLPFYPACNFELVGELDVVGAPIREFHGNSDDWTPPGVCRDYIGRLREAGHDVLMIEYPGARHAFDNIKSPALWIDSEAQTSRNCFRREEANRLLNDATGRPFSYADSCVEYGPSSQYNPSAAEAAQSDVSEFLLTLKNQ